MDFSSAGDVQMGRAQPKAGRRVAPLCGGFQMVSGWWDRQVRVMIGSSTTHNVTRPSRAAELLMNEWPDEGGPAYKRAKAAVLKAMETPESDSLMMASRLAFEEAAREAGILVPLPEGGDYIRR